VFSKNKQAKQKQKKRGKVTRHVGEWILNIYSPTANFGRVGEWSSTTLVNRMST
jgi:hypothetical protein